MAVSVSLDLAFTVQQVWSIISDFGGLARWHPQIASCKVTGTGIGAVRRADFGTWWAEEQLVNLDEEMHRLGYLVIASSRPEIIGVSATMALTRNADHTTRLDWSSGHTADHPHAGDVNPGLEAYYPVRIEHLRAALAQQV